MTELMTAVVAATLVIGSACTFLVACWFADETAANETLTQQSRLVPVATVKQWFVRARVKGSRRWQWLRVELWGDNYVTLSHHGKRKTLPKIDLAAATLMCV